jgi:uncharacterized membrane protein
MSDAATGAKTVRPRNVPLVVSLCLNVALVAMIVAGAVNAVRFGRPPPTMMAPQALIDEASPSERAKIQTIIAAHAGKVRQLRQADIAARQGVFRVFGSASFTPDAFGKALAYALAADDALRAEQTAITAETVSQLSHAERQDAARKIDRKLRWWRFFRRHFGG